MWLLCMDLILPRSSIVVESHCRRLLTCCCGVILAIIQFCTLMAYGGINDTQTMPREHVAVRARMPKTSLVRLHLVNNLSVAEFVLVINVRDVLMLKLSNVKVEPVTLSKIVGYNAEDDVTSEKWSSNNRCESRPLIYMVGIDHHWDWENSCLRNWNRTPLRSVELIKTKIDRRLIPKLDKK
jgi:hypothetical protein